MFNEVEFIRINKHLMTDRDFDNIFGFAYRQYFTYSTLVEGVTPLSFDKWARIINQEVDLPDTSVNLKGIAKERCEDDTGRGL